MGNRTMFKILEKITGTSIVVSFKSQHYHKQPQNIQVDNNVIQKSSKKAKKIPGNCNKLTKNIHGASL